MGAEGADLGGTLGPKPCADARSAIAGVKTLVNDRVSGSRCDERVPCAVGAGAPIPPRPVPVSVGARLPAAVTVAERVLIPGSEANISDAAIGCAQRQTPHRG